MSSGRAGERPLSLINLVKHFGDHGRRHTKPAQAKPLNACGYLARIAAPRRPLPFDVGPYDTVYRQRLARRIDIRKDSQIVTALEFFDQRSQDLPVGGADRRAQRTSAIWASSDIWRRSERISSLKARSSRPSIHAATARTGSEVPPSAVPKPHHLECAPSPRNSGRHELVLGVEVPVERSGAQLGPAEHTSDGQRPDAFLPNNFRCGGQNARRAPADRARASCARRL